MKWIWCWMKMKLGVIDRSLVLWHFLPAALRLVQMSGMVSVSCGWGRLEWEGLVDRGHRLSRHDVHVQQIDSVASVISNEEAEQMQLYHHAAAYTTANICTGTTTWVSWSLRTSASTLELTQAVKPKHSHVSWGDRVFWDLCGSVVKRHLNVTPSTKHQQ